MPRPIVLAILFTAACATAPQKPSEKPAAPAAGAQPQPDHRAELTAALKRELEKDSPAREVVGPGGLFRAQVEAAADPKVEDGDKSVTVTIPIGTKEPVLCFVYKGSIDAGVSMRNMIDALAKSVEIKAVHPVEMAAVGERPAVFVELVYLAAGEGGEKALGHVKLMASAVDPTAAVCLHDELGYSETFRRVTKSFLATLTPRPKAPRFAEISIFRVDGVPVGIEHRRVWDRKEGGTVQEDSAVLLVLKSDSELVVEDTVAGETGDAEGRLDSYSYLKARDGEVLVTAEVKRASSGGYEVKGTNEGKDFKATLKPIDKRGLPTDLFIQRALRDELLGGKKKELALDRYDANADPTRLSQAVYRRGAGAREVEFASGDVRYTGTVSPEGTIEKMAMPMDGHEMTMERVFASGSP